MKDLIDAQVVADELGIPIAKLWQMSLAGRFVDMFRFGRGLYRVSRQEFEHWKQSCSASRVNARAEMTRERVRSGDA